MSDYKQYDDDNAKLFMVTNPLVAVRIPISTGPGDYVEGTIVI